ncbi:MFS transporter [Ruegeria sp. HKCCD6228]|uniref:MFS transporter n=1 Tax=unclassified Ruegeria TaxID=2625375 RepID=UPI001488EF40|nr:MULTISPECIES: MFS transporter [unclassified Ruegeria]NOD97663.1 MFS transporter [Ruegeria sp. HKCCD6228]
MIRALNENWALFLGMFMLMVANGLLATLLTIRGASLGFSDFTISVMQASYPLGALAGTALAPRLVENVGHIRAFSALASLVSIAAIVHLLTSDAISWSVMRLLGGFCYPGLYVITESWLNAKSENNMRAQVLSLYFIIQLAGPALGTAIVGFPDPTGNLLFGLVSILISLSIVPLLLSGNKAPEYAAPERMSVPVLYKVSPIAVIGIVLVSIGVAASYISLPLYALQNGFTTAQASGALVAALIAGAVVQYPVGWLSDHTDRRYVVIGLGVVTTLSSLWMAIDTSPSHIVYGFVLIAIGLYPAYSILTAHANDQLKLSQIVPASGTMVLLLNVGLLVGTMLGPNSISLLGGRGLPFLLAAIGIAVALFALIRRVQVAAPTDTGDVQVVGIIGTGQPGVLQAETWVQEEESRTNPDSSQGFKA